MGGTLSVPTETWAAANKILGGNKDKKISGENYKNFTCEILFKDDKPHVLVGKGTGHVAFSFATDNIQRIHVVSGTRDIILETPTGLYLFSAELDLMNKPKKSPEEVETILKELAGFTTGYTTIYQT